MKILYKLAIIANKIAFTLFCLAEFVFGIACLIMPFVWAYNTGYWALLLLYIAAIPFGMYFIVESIEMYKDFKQLNKKP